MIDVSVCIICYNQEQYIAQAIESALCQHHSFQMEVIVCDDRSTDDTPRIIDWYAAANPDRIKVYSAQTNLGMLRNWERALKLCKGRYIALLEGDDFWIDENKLQKQYDILQARPDYSLSFTNARILYEQGDGYPIYVTDKTETYTTTDLMKGNFIPTCSVLMRNNISETFFPPAYFKSPFADWIIHVLNSFYGKLHYLDEFSCCYRVHVSGVWGGINQEKQLLNKWRVLNCINEIVSDKTHKAVLRESMRQALQKICAWYKNKGDYANYLNYRLKLVLK